VPCPFQGHINPMFQLGTILHSKGFSITIAHTLFNFPNPSDHPDFDFLPISDGVSKEEFTENFAAFVSSLNVHCEIPFQQALLRMIQNQDSHDDLPCIIYDGLMYFAEAVAHHLKLPSINLRAFSATYFLLYHIYPRLKEEGYIPVKDYMREDKTPVLQSLKLKNVFESMPQSARDAMLEHRAALTDSLKRSSAIIVNTMDFLEQEILTNIQKLFSAPIFTIGPFHKLAPTISSTSIFQEDATCISWLNKQVPKSVIYVSFGSMASMNENELHETAWGLANSEQPFLWVIRPGLVQGVDWLKLLPEGFKERIGERGCIVKWAPQKEVLAHVAVGGFWSHCGWNSTLESICEGIPMLCRPFFGDQLLNVRYVCDVWKVGLELDSELDRGKIEIAVRKLMVDTEGEDIRQRAMEFKKKVDHCLGESGSSLECLNELTEKILSV
ncbi:UDPGT domain-containing protein, partial [Cephalotus follicularis]